MNEILKFIEKSFVKMGLGSSYDNAIKNPPIKVIGEKLIYEHETRGKVNIKVGRYITGFVRLSSMCDDSMVQRVARDVIAEYRPIEEIGNDIKILTGEDVADYYKNVDPSCGGSCMTGTSRQNLLDLYRFNDNIKLLTVKLHGKKGTGRALLWELDSGETFLDRIYPNDGTHVQLVTKYARLNKWLIRSNHYAPGQGGDVIDPEGNARAAWISVIPMKRFPYLDTLCNGHLKYPKLILCNSLAHKESEKYFTGTYKMTTYTFRSTGGEIGKVHRKICSMCGNLASRDITLLMGGSREKSELKEILGLSQQKRSNNAFVDRVNVCDACYASFGLCRSCGIQTLLKDLNENKRCPECALPDEKLIDKMKIQWEEIAIVAKGSGQISIEQSGNVILS